MSRGRRSPSQSEARRTHPFLPRALWVVVAAAVLLIPCTMSRKGRDPFRAPKEYAFRAAALLAGTLLAASAVATPLWRPLPRSAKPAFAVAGVAVAWTAIATIFSLNRALSVWSLLYVALAAIFFVAATLAVRTRGWSAVYVLLLPALVNTAILVIQDLRIWDPVYPLAEPSSHTALVGNSNDVGAYLLTAAIAATVLFVADSSRRLRNGAMTLALIAGLTLSQSVTALAAYSAGILVLAALLSWRKALIAVVALPIIAGVVVATHKPLLRRAIAIERWLSAGDLDKVTSGRLTAFVAAVRMCAHRPWVGVGPGCYAFLYFDEKIAAEARYPMLQNSPSRLYSFGEAHSDHLQIAATAGLPGYAIFLAAIAVLVSFGIHRRQSESARDRFVRLYSVTLPASAVVLMLAQFPLEIAASTVSLLYGAAICTAWVER